MGNPSCTLHPQVNGEDSKLHKDLLSMNIKRPIVNLLYAMYKTGDMANDMDKAGITSKDRLGEHKAKDVLKFFDYFTWEDEFNTLRDKEIRLGAIDINGQRIDYTDAKDALERADNFNNTHKGLVANVYKHGDIFNIIVSEKNTDSFDRGVDVKQRLQAWDVYQQVFNTVNVDITSMPPELKGSISAFNSRLIDELQNLQAAQNKFLFKKDALMLFYLNSNNAKVKALLRPGVFNSFEEAAQALDDMNHRTGNYTPHQRIILLEAINDAKRFNGIDLDALKQQIDHTVSQVWNNSPEAEIRKTINILNRKYHLDINEIHRTSDTIKSLSDASTEAIIQLQRKLNQLKRQKSNDSSERQQVLQEEKRLGKIQDSLMREIANKQYYVGLLKFLDEANNAVLEFDNILQSTRQTGTNLEIIMDKAKALQSIREIKDQYAYIVEALARKNLKIDESINQVDIDNLHQMAEQVMTVFNTKEPIIRNLAESTMTSLLKEIIGKTAPDGQIISNVVNMYAADSSIWDFFYSMGRASNPIIAAMGSITRQAQDGRDAIMNKIALRVRRATDRLYKSGVKNTEFMYEDNAHIISDIDWKKYSKARRKYIKGLYSQGLRGYELKEKIEEWEDNNTEERVMDITNGRTERVPDTKYRKAFPDLTDPQQEYYDTMMQIKGELGSLLPDYAQHQYLPPQLRRNMFDAFGKGEILTGIKNKIKDIYTIREDDTDYNTNGIIDGTQYDFAEGTFGNTPLKQIPIFYINKVEGSELLKDFSAGIQALAKTAINYDAMNRVIDVIKFMGDFTKEQIAAVDAKNPKAQVIENSFLRVIKDLKDVSIKNGLTTKLIDAFIDQHYYGVIKRPKENSLWYRLGDKLLGYNSFKGLATNVFGAVSNVVVAEWQMFIEAGCGQFYGWKDFLWAHKKLFGGGGVSGEVAELLTNNVRHKSYLLREMFDPMQENFEKKGHERYHSSAFRQLLSNDCSFILYGSGEFAVHYINMYSVLHKEKVKLNGKTISLYDAFETITKDNNAELVIKQGVTTLDGKPVDEDYINKIRNKVKYVNQTTHGSMNKEDKGIVHQYFMGRAAMNFRQWMVEHYSRRFRSRHFDASLWNEETGELGAEIEGYWTSVKKGLWNEDTKELWKDKQRIKAVGEILKDFSTFLFRSSTNWDKLDEMQKRNVRRAKTEFIMWLILAFAISPALGEPDEHKREWWTKFAIYQTRRLKLDVDAGLPFHYKMLSNQLTLLNSPISGVSTANSLLYALAGWTEDAGVKLKSGPNKGEDKYWRNVKKYTLPFIKDIEKLQNFGEDQAIFKVFESSPRK